MTAAMNHQALHLALSTHVVSAAVSPVVVTVTPPPVTKVIKITDTKLLCFFDPRSLA